MTGPDRFPLFDHLGGETDRGRRREPTSFIGRDIRDARSDLALFSENMRILNEATGVDGTLAELSEYAWRRARKTGLIVWARYAAILADMARQSQHHASADQVSRAGE